MDSVSASTGNGNGSVNHSHRHTAYHTQQLEEFFKNCSHPDEAQRAQLGMALGLEPKRIKFWFQNRRTQLKAQKEKAEARNLKVENEKLKLEQLELKEACKRLKGQKCEGTSIGKVPQQLQFENTYLEHERQGPCRYLPSGLDRATELNRRESNKRAMIETANSAMTELVELLEKWDSFWVRSPIDGRLVLDCDIYNKIFPRINRFHNFTRIESSKDSIVVALSATALVNMFMDPNKWLDLFPTIVAKARKIEVLDTSMMGEDAGTLQLMHARLHILSPLVVAREIYFLRYSKEIRPTRWVIVDFSCDYSSVGQAASSFVSWKRPSGCLIQDKPNGFSEITWVEHVEVDSRYQVNNLYSDVLSGGGAYGAERWLLTLQRMVERLQCYAGASFHNEHGGINMSEMRKSLMDLSLQMVKKFVAMLSMSTHNFLNLELHNGAHVSVIRSNEPGQASGTVLAVCSSVWLPIPCHTLFSFLRDEKTRSQWDVLSTGNSAREFAHISCGTQLGNRISIIQTTAPDMLLLQESCTHNLDSLIVYTPVRSTLLESALRGQNPESISLVPAGFIISDDEKGTVKGSTSTGGETSYKRHGSFLTVATQVMTILPLENLPFETLERTSTLTCSIVDKVKVALGCHQRSKRF